VAHRSLLVFVLEHSGHCVSVPKGGYSTVSQSSLLALASKPQLRQRILVVGAVGFAMFRDMTHCIICVFLGQSLRVRLQFLLPGDSRFASEFGVLLPPDREGS
jgi:hypothetical protein